MGQSVVGHLAAAALAADPGFRTDTSEAFPRRMATSRSVPAIPARNGRSGVGRADCRRPQPAKRCRFLDALPSASCPHHNSGIGRRQSALCVVYGNVAGKCAGAGTHSASFLQGNSRRTKSERRMSWLIGQKCPLDPRTEEEDSHESRLYFFPLYPSFLAAVKSASALDSSPIC